MPNKNYTPKPRSYNPGESGYRNRGRQTGLDPFDSYQEAGRMEGLFFRHLLRGTLRTHNPMVVLILLVGGFLLTVGALGMVVGVITDNSYGDLDNALWLGMMIVFSQGLAF